MTCGNRHPMRSREFMVNDRYPFGDGRRPVMVADRYPLWSAVSGDPFRPVMAKPVMGTSRLMVEDRYPPGYRVGAADAPVAHRYSGVVLISGYTGPVLTQQALSAGIDHILTKPLDLRQIAEAMVKVLTRETTR